MVVHPADPVVAGSREDEAGRTFAPVNLMSQTSGDAGEHVTWGVTRLPLAA